MDKQKSINNLKIMACEMINNAGSGHSGIVLGGTSIVYSLYHDIINVIPFDPKNIFRDRFVLSSGHGSAMLYSILHACGFDITNADLQKFRKGGILAGHPEINIPGVDVSTGPLGTGVATAVGLAVAERMCASRFNKPNIKLFDNYTYAYIGEGCLMEGVSYEALSLAGVLQLNKLIVLYDCNSVTLDSDVKNTLTMDVPAYFKSLGFNVLTTTTQSVDNISKAIKKAKKASKPTLIMIKTHIGEGTCDADTSKAHGKVLTSDEIANLREIYGIHCDKFSLCDDVKKDFEIAKQRFNAFAHKKNIELRAYKDKYPAEYVELRKFLNNKYVVPYEKIKMTDDMSTRDICGKLANFVAKYMPAFVGGCADVSGSTRAKIIGSDNISKRDFSGRNIQYGIREFGMSCITNGIALYGGFQPFCSTFVSFSDQMKNGIRLSALMNLPVMYILSHDSIAVGEDGPTHQPIEQITGLRAMPGLNVFRPCNFVETCYAFSQFTQNHTPTVLITSRQAIHAPNVSVTDVACGGYVISNVCNPIVTLIATGSEVDIALKVQNCLKERGIGARVVSMPCSTVFDVQPAKYKQKTIPKDTLRVFIEASDASIGYKYVGDDGIVCGVNNYGVSDTAENNYTKAGLTATNIVNKIVEKLKK